MYIRFDTVRALDRRKLQDTTLVHQ